MTIKEFYVDFNYQEFEGEDWMFGGGIVEASCESDIESTLLEQYNDVEILEYKEVVEE